MEIGGRMMTSKENEETEGKVAMKVAAESDCGGRDRSGEMAVALLLTDEMKNELDVMYSYT
jgi:hypothetical protein